MTCLGGMRSIVEEQWQTGSCRSNVWITEMVCTCAAFSLDRKLLYSAESDGSVRVLNEDTRAFHDRCRGHTIGASSIIPMEWGFISASHDGSVRCWRFGGDETGVVTASSELKKFTCTNNFCPHDGLPVFLAGLLGDTLFTAGKDGRMCFWKVAYDGAAEKKSVSVTFSGTLECGSPDPDIGPSAVDMSIAAWSNCRPPGFTVVDVEAKTHTFFPLTVEEGAVVALGVADGHAAVGTGAGYVKVANKTAVIATATLNAQDRATSIVVCGETVVAITAKGNVVFIRLKTGAIITQFTPSSPPTCIASRRMVWMKGFSSVAGATTVVTGHEDGAIVLWGVANATKIARIEGHFAPASGVWADRYSVVTTGADSTLRVYVMAYEGATEDDSEAMYLRARVVRASALREDGNRAFKRRNYEEAVQSWKEAEECFPVDPRPALNQAQVFLQQGKWQLAEGAARRALAALQSTANMQLLWQHKLQLDAMTEADLTNKGLLRLASALERQELYDEALAYYNQYLSDASGEKREYLERVESKVKEVTFQQKLAELLARIAQIRGEGNLSEAIAQLEQAYVEFFPKAPIVSLHLLDALVEVCEKGSDRGDTFQQGDFEKAMDILPRVEDAKGELKKEQQEQCAVCSLWVA